MERSKQQKADSFSASQFLLAVRQITQFPKMKVSIQSFQGISQNTKETFYSASNFKTINFDLDIFKLESRKTSLPETG